MTDHDHLGRTRFTSLRPDGNIDLEVAPGQQVCDFCLSPNPAWEYPCGFVALIGNPDIEASDDEWAACDPCRALIEAGDINQLVAHMIDNQRTVAIAQGYYRRSRAQMMQSAKSNVLAFLAARTGPARPWSA